MPAKNQDALLQEYKICSDQVARLDNLIWQTGSIIFPITLAGFAFFGSSDQHTNEQLFVIVATAIGSSALLIAWYLLSRRWYVYQRVAFYRMREIEEQLGLWHYRYGALIRKSPRKRKLALEQMNGVEKSRFEKVSEQAGNVPRIGLRRTTALITIVFVIGWIGLIIREIMLTF